MTRNAPPIMRLDIQSAILLRQMFLERLDRINENYPTLGSVGRTKAIDTLIHLMHELGIKNAEEILREHVGRIAV